MGSTEPPDASTEYPPVDPEPAPPPEDSTPVVDERDSTEDQPSTWQPLLYTKIALLLLVVAYAIAFVVQNTDQIKIDFILASAKVRLVWEILLLLAVGVIAGVLLSQLYRHRRRAQLAKRVR